MADTSLSDLFNELNMEANSQTLYLIFVMACRVPSSKETKLSAVSKGTTRFTDKDIPQIVENIIGVSNDVLNYENTISQANGKQLANEFNKKLFLKEKLYNFVATCSNKRQRINDKANGGSVPKNRHEYLIHKEKESNRKYVLIKRQRWYFDEHRGKYRYTDDRLHATIIGQH